MTNRYGVQLLKELILAHKNLKEVDKPVVAKLCDKLSITQDHGYINEYFREQVDAEATGLYLKSKYSEILAKLQGLVDQHKAGKSVELGARDDEGLKWTKPSLENYMRGTDARYVALMELVRESERLLSMLRGLDDIINNRDYKLKELSVNYRREMKSDSNDR